MNDLPHDDIGRVLGCSEEAARRNVHEGLKKLRGAWETMNELEQRAAARRAHGRATAAAAAAGGSPTRAEQRGPAGRRLHDASTRPWARARRRDAARPRADLVRRDLRPHDEVLARARASDVSPRVLEAPARASTPSGASSTSTSRAAAREFDLPLDWSLTGGFGRRVLKRTARDPVRRGLHLQGAWPRRPAAPAARARPGNALGSNPIPIVVPCHRVLHCGGGLGGYGGGPTARSSC